jgi:hypothetical protein
MLKGVKTALIIAVVVFVGVFIAGYYYEYPQSKEPIIMGFDEKWNMGSDIKAGTVGRSWKIIPILDFEHNGINYTTSGDTGLPANIVFLDEKDALINAGTSSGRTFQKFFTTNDNENIYALYAVIEGNNVYYTIEELYSKVHYTFTFEQKENKVIISHRPDILSFIFNWLSLSFMAGIVIFCLILLWINRNEKA